MKQKPGTPFLTFELTDADGDAHEYQLTRHPASRGEGLWLTTWFTAHAGGQLAGLVAGGGLDAGVDLSSLRDAMLSDGEDVVGRIVAHTFRDGKRLADEHEFSKAYAGNYAEMWACVGKVVALNRFFPLPPTWSAVIGAKLRDALQSLPGLMSVAMAGESDTSDD